jgi:pyruvate/2-oxoacid:ferredoxin oxidoreductase beta subunit/NAD-dependent dihydropyrimidine dehydrogenase PreA subunit
MTTKPKKTTKKGPMTSRELPMMNAAEFRERVVGAYNSGTAEMRLEADSDVARSLIPAGTGALRDFSYLSPDIPVFDATQCVGCMDCVTQCPDTAILAKVVADSDLDKVLAKEEDPIQRDHLREQFVQTTKYFDVPVRQGKEGGQFSIFIDPTKCKGCSECVEACGVHSALRMIPKEENTVPAYTRDFAFFEGLPYTSTDYINEKSLVDMMLAEKSLLYTGGAGSCMGCGEATAIRMMMAATGFVYGEDSFGIVAATGCNTVYGSTYPYNPYKVPWMNPLFENAPADAMGVRLKWDQNGQKDKKLWVLGGDGAMLDIGFQSLSRMLMSGMNIKVLVLDTQVYSNTGGQASMGTFVGQEAKMSYFGQTVKGKKESRKELGLIAMMHPNVFVAQVIASNPNHFYKAIMAANEYDGPAIINCYTTCQPEHGVGDDMAARQAKLACDTRAFPIFIYDPRKGDTIQERLDLAGNPARNQDWFIDPKTEKPMDFIEFARTEGRFAKHFDKDGGHSPEMDLARQERLTNWHRLQEMAGLLKPAPKEKPAPPAAAAT